MWLFYFRATSWFFSIQSQWKLLEQFPNIDMGQKETDMSKVFWSLCSHYRHIKYWMESGYKVLNLEKYRDKVLLRIRFVDCKVNRTLWRTFVMVTKWTKWNDRMNVRVSTCILKYINCRQIQTMYPLLFEIAICQL